MEINKVRNNHNLTMGDHVNHSSSIDQISEEEVKALQKLAFLESNYAKMQTEQSKKIRELKNALKERTQRQSTLSVQLIELVKELKQQQEQIQKVTQQLTEEQQKSVEISHKKNNSPGVIKKSVEMHKKPSTRISPTAHSTKLINTQHTPLVKKETTKTDIHGTSDTIKRPTSGSPSNSKKSIKLVPKQMVTNLKISPKKPSYSPLFKAIQKNSSPMTTKRKQASHKGAIKLRELLGKSEKQMVNGSPKKGARVSPGVQPRKKLLANIKESMQEQAF